MEFKAVMELIRAENIPKNLLWFFVGAIIPLRFSFDPILLLLALGSYNLLWFFAYALNDYLDYNEDKIHKRKALRPLPSGRISLSEAKTLILSFVIFSAILASLVSTPFLLVVLGTIIAILLYNSPQLCCRNRIYLAAPLLWFMEFFRLLAGAMHLGYMSNDWLLLLGLPTTYLFVYHFYWEDAKRFKQNLKLSKLVFLFASSFLIASWLLNLSFSLEIVAIFAMWSVVTVIGAYFVSKMPAYKQLKYSYYFTYLSLLSVMAILWVQM